jgi:hypothetical protein
VLFSVNFCYPWRLQCAVLQLVYDDRWESSLICTNSCQQCYPLMWAVLQRYPHLLALPLTSTEDPFWAHCNTNHEAFFIHIVGVMGLNLVLKHLWMQEIKVQLVLSSAVGIVALRINSRGPFWDEMITVLANKVVHPGLAYAVRVKVQGKIFDHGSRWRQRSLCKFLNIAYELCFLLWTESKLGGVFCFP